MCATCIHIHPFRRCHSLGVYSTEYPVVATGGSDLTCLPEEGAYRVREYIWIYFIRFVELLECWLGSHQDAYQRDYPTRWTITLRGPTDDLVFNMEEVMRQDKCMEEVSIHPTCTVWSTSRPKISMPLLQWHDSWLMTTTFLSRHGPVVHPKTTKGRVKRRSSKSASK